MIRALTGYSTRNPWKVIGLWAVLGFALIALAPTMTARVTQHQTGNFLPPSYDSAAALRIAQEQFGVDPDATTVTVLVARSDGSALSAADQQRVEAEAAKLSQRRVTMPREDDVPQFLVPDASQTPRIAPAMTAPDRSFELLAVQLTGNPADQGVQGVYRTFRDATRTQFADLGMRTGFTGGLADQVDSTDANETATKVGGALVTGLIVLLNVLVFRSVLAAVLPLLAVAMIGGVAAGAVAGAAMITGSKLDPGTPGLINVVLLGIGIDYLLFLLFRFREQLRNRPEQPAREAAAQVSGRVGTAITSAALTIVAAFATLGLATFGQFRSLGPAIATAVLVMLLGSLTLMPALLAAAGRKMFWPSRTLRREPPEGRAARFGALVTRRPLAMLALSVALLAALAAGLTGIRMDYGRGGSGERTPAVATAAEISRALPAGVSDPTSVFVTATDGGTLSTAGLDGLSRALTQVGGVGQVAPTVLNKDHRAARIDLYPTADPQSQQARDLASGPIRAAAAQHTPAGTTAHVGGTAAILADVATAVDHDLTIVFPVAAALIALILLLLLRSLFAPVVLMLSVGLGFAATLGAATLLFQHALGRPGVSFTLPLVLFLFVVALGTDYNILIADRIREEMQRPGPARAAVARAVRHTAPAIATAGLVLAGSFATLATTPGSEQVAFAMALGIMLSALVLSLVLVPALAALLGRALWWPVRPRPTAGGHPQHRETAPAPEVDRVTAY
ncbi:MULTISPECIES: MMPL family transporter [unclassified Kitasatospora]|uniref:MMPL family transporter n=1 Tax=unclassified Kitasatospora TaxID=2633591 RepID=UPI00070D60C0|nr:MULTISPECIES: MMPL family transporter [unclassified Kitasatospora]KQV18326.1 multidrug transporter [Kitasatospora sp. Root107]KRB74311.1 multidrug transporter [Kitasatospora sp. Root187]